MSLEIAGVRLAAEIGLASILADSENGLSIDEIAGKTGVDGSKLGTFLDILRSLYSKIIAERVIRLLVTQGWFREPKQGFFANNRLSNLIKNDQAGFYLATYMYGLVSSPSSRVKLIYKPNN